MQTTLNLGESQPSIAVYYFFATEKLDNPIIHIIWIHHGELKKKLTWS